MNPSFRFRALISSQVHTAYRFLGNHAESISHRRWVFNGINHAVWGPYSRFWGDPGAEACVSCLGSLPALKTLADVAELADALDLGSSGATRAGSIPVIRIADTSQIRGVFFCGWIKKKSTRCTEAKDASWGIRGWCSRVMGNRRCRCSGTLIHRRSRMSRRC